MMYSSPSTSTRIRGHQPQPLTPSQRLNRCLSPLGGDGRHRNPVKSITASLFPPLPTAPPLPRIISDPTPPVTRLTALIATTPALSRASTLPSSPLDEVPERLWDRVLLTSGSRAPETTNPNLSLEEIISTRLSLDEHRFLSPKNHSSSPPRIPHPATMGVQKVLRNGVKSLRKKAQRIRRSIFSKTSRGSRASPAPAITPVVEGSVSKNTSRVSLTEWLSNEESNPPSIIAREVPELSPAYPQDGRFQCAESLQMANNVRVTNPRPISSLPSQITFDFIRGHSISKERSFRVSRGHSFRSINSRSSTSRRNRRRHSSVEAEESRRRALFYLRYRFDAILHPQTARNSRASVGSNSSPRSFSRRNSAPTRPPVTERISRTSFGPNASPLSFSRPHSAPPRHTQQPILEVARRGVYYMDAPSQNSDLFWNNRNLFRRRSFSSDDPPRARTRRPSFWRARNPVFRYPPIHQGAGDIPGYTKVAYYAPCSIEQKPEHLCGQTCIPLEEGYKFGPDCLGSSKSRPKPTCVSDLVIASLPSPPRAYDAVLSDYSRASIDGQASIRSQFERDELMEEPEEEVESFNTGRLSRALSTVFHNTDLLPN